MANDNGLFICKQLMPWRKGPYHLHGIHIDCEWRSDFKWQRILPHLSLAKRSYDT